MGTVFRITTQDFRFTPMLILQAHSDVGTDRPGPYYAVGPAHSSVLAPQLHEIINPLQQNHDDVSQTQNRVGHEYFEKVMQRIFFDY